MKMNTKQIKQFNQMREALMLIHKQYLSPERLRKTKESEFLGFDETITMAYENIQETARIAVKGVKYIKTEVEKAKIDWKGSINLKWRKINSFAWME